jgi:hypothetical protein
MDTLALEAAALWRILAVSLLLGAGLPALFAVGIRASALASGGAAEDDGARPRPGARAVAVLCFGVVLLAVALGITFVVASGFGKALSFEHVYPMIVDK